MLSIKAGRFDGFLRIHPKTRSHLRALAAGPGPIVPTGRVLKTMKGWPSLSTSVESGDSRTVARATTLDCSDR